MMFDGDTVRFILLLEIPLWCNGAMNELGIVIILLVCGAAIAAVAIIVAKLVARNEEKRSAAESEQVAESVKYQYRAGGRMMSDLQQGFYLKLTETFGERCYIFPNVALAAILDTEIDGQDAKKALESITGQTVDYVMCHADSFRILCVVILGDDQRVATLMDAGLPVAVMSEAERMNKQEIVDQIAVAIRKKN